MPAKITVARAKGRNPFLSITGLLALILGLLFYRSFIPQNVVFSNDGPLGGLVAEQNQLPQTFTGLWADLNSIGSNGGAATLSISSLLRTIFGPVGYAKCFAPAALFILGLGAMAFFRALKFSPLAVALGTLAAVLNSTFFSDACWGVASHEIAAGMDFFALGLIAANVRETPQLVRWARLALAGLCVGMNVIEAADIGALYSILIAAFAFFKEFAVEEKALAKKLVTGISCVAVVAVFAGFIAMQTVLGLVGTSIQGIAGTAQDAETKLHHWDYATQWSEPKIETLGLIIPGLFGYRMDTPQNMMPAFQDSYQGGVYWGGIGRDPAIDRYFDSGATGSPPQGFMRFSGGGNYCGILVALVALWTIAQSFRRNRSPFTGAEKKFVWFWAAVMLISLLLAWGRFAPFYTLLYQLPYFSTIRNPSKFLIYWSWAMVVLFGYGIQVLQRQHQKTATANTGGAATQLKNWWTKADVFDRRWTWVCAGIWLASMLGWFIYASEEPALMRYLQARGFPDEDFAKEILAFSLGQAGWWLVLFAIAIGLLILNIAGCFNGPRARWGGLLLGGFLIFDLGRANLPFNIHWDYKQKYEVGSLNPIETFLSDRPYEHRVAKLLPAPLSTPSEFQLFDELYNIEWTQHHFPYYNIQSLDIIQMPRMPEDLQAYLDALHIGIKQNAAGQYQLDETTFPKLTRLWELSNTRYLLGPAAFLDLFNTQFDPGQNRFRIVQRFSVNLRPGVSEFHQKLEELTAYPNPAGDYALFDFTGALPRAKLYASWQVNTNDQAVLKTLADLNFDPAKMVLVDTPQKNLPALATNENSGTVEFKSYAPKRIVLAVNSPQPSVLLLNDKYDPNWHVTVDGQPAELLRCNFIMRGVSMPAGSHTVEFQFHLPNKMLLATIASIAIGILLCGFLWRFNPRRP